VKRVGLFKSKSNSHKKRDGRPKGDRKKVKYVYLSSKKAIFLVTGEPKESKYSYGVPIIPLHGYYRADGKTYTAKELSDYFVVLNLPKDADIDGLEGKKVVVLGYDKDELYIDEGDDEGGEKE
jgi:hypothetical protein